MCGGVQLNDGEVILLNLVGSMHGPLVRQELAKDIFTKAKKEMDKEQKSLRDDKKSNLLFQKIIRLIYNRASYDALFFLISELIGPR